MMSNEHPASFALRDVAVRGRLVLHSRNMSGSTLRSAAPGLRTAAQMLGDQARTRLQLMDPWPAAG
jgi:hypothetical protein